MGSLTIGSLFSGIGGLELGLERAGMGPVLWQAEQDAFCRGILAKHWPEADRFADVRDLRGVHDIDCDMDDDCRCPAVTADVICGGFPCQDISPAGNKGGIYGERSGLWEEFARIVGEVVPRIVVVENSAALANRGLGRVLGDLATLGYDAWWDCIPAAAVGAPFRRDRAFIVATKEPWLEALADPCCWRWERERGAQSAGLGCEYGGESDGCGTNGGVYGATGTGWWEREPQVARVAYGVSGGVDRRRAHGNAVVPQVAEVIGRAIMEAINA